ncbi:immunoglobulin domain-containing protein [Persicitalea jodogahamensis]|uniref:Ig-like domain-containing protein n=1 Tax=Persicitalea jodogahamensis TaxID=402147 RepID=A0A8J3DAJ9_9BACT|nr:hypothetical protein [Persicitalea jodogahamensis]GHB76264.1 hypothetical protein GCM10007390_32700 [Persicitalea jodogahamensis]
MKLSFWNNFLPYFSWYIPYAFTIALMIPNLAQANVPEDDLPTPLASNVVRCGSGNVTFTATGCTTGNGPKWFESSTLSNEVGSGMTFTTPSLDKTTDYFLACVSNDDSNLKSAAVKVTAVVKPALVVTLSGIDSLCDNSFRAYWGSPTGGTFTLSENLSKDYYSVYAGNYLVLLAGSGIPTVNIDYTYTDPTTGCSATASKTITSIPAPTPSVNSPTICEGDTAILTIENCSGTIGWFGGGIYGGSKVMQVAPTVTTDYYAHCFSGGCDSLMNAKVTVIPRPTALISGPDAICQSGLPFSFVGTPAGGSFILPEGLPSGAVTVSENQLTVNPGFEIAHKAFRYQVAYASAECATVLTANKFLTITPPIKPTVTAPVTICAGDNVNLKIDNCPGKAYWSNGYQAFYTYVSPTVTTDYSVRCTVGGCDTTLFTKVTVNGVLPPINYVDSSCDPANNTGSLRVITSQGATLTTDSGILDGTRIYGIPDYKTATISSTMNGCTAQLKLTFNCGAYPNANCFYNRIDTISATAATCSGTSLNSDASILIDAVYADRYTYAKTLAELLPYSKSTEVLNYKIAITDLPNPGSPAGQIYFVRIYNRSDSCSFDTTVVVPFRDCRIPCAKPDAGGDYFSTGMWSIFQLPTAGPLQKWSAAHSNPSGTINAATGSVNGLFLGGKYLFILSDSGPGGPCADTVVVYNGIQELPTITIYSDTLTLPKYLINQWDGKKLTNVYGIWSPLPGNPATLTYSGKASGLTVPGEYKFVMNIPFDKNYPFGQPNTLTLTVIKLDDCPPQQCIPFSIKKIKLAAK